MSLRPQLAPLAVLCAAVASLALAACGGSSSSGKPAAATGADNALKFSQCMREHGVKNFPNPEIISGGRVHLSVKSGGPNGINVSPQTMEAAQNAFKHFQATSEPNQTSQEKVAREEAVLKFAKCMREHGVNIHASTAGGNIQMRIGSGHEGGERGPNPESPAFQAAQKACQGLLPFKGGGPGAGTVTGGKGGAGLSIGG